MHHGPRSHARHSEHPDALRLWLRLLTCTQLIEKQVRSGLREQFDTTLAALRPHGAAGAPQDGMKMNELSRRMMVTGGNVTGITDQLVPEGLVERVDVAGDRRAWLRAPDAQGPQAVQRHGAAARSAGSSSAFAGLSAKEVATLHKLLGKVKQHTSVPIDGDSHEALHRRGQPHARRSSNPLAGYAAAALRLGVRRRRRHASR